MENIIEIPKTQVIMAFVATCIETTARLLNASYKEVYQRMKNVGMIEHYIIPHYEALHSESRENIAEGMVECLNNWEGKATALRRLSEHQPNNQMCLLNQEITDKYLIFDGTAEIR